MHDTFQGPVQGVLEAMAAAIRPNHRPPGASLRAEAESIVSSAGTSPIQAGRGAAWLKSKCSKRAAFIIGGFTLPEGSRSGIGALLLGYQDAGTLRLAGKGAPVPGSRRSTSQIRRELEPTCRQQLGGA